MLNVDKVMLWQYLIVGLDQTVHGSEEELSDLRHTLLYVERQLTLANTSFGDSLSTTLLRIDEMLRYGNPNFCSWGGTRRQQPCNRDWFKKVVTASGNCLTFNYNGNFTQVSTGPDAGLHIAINMWNSLNGGM